MLRFLVVAAILIPGLLMALQDRFVALLLYLWFAFFRPQDWIWFDITNLRLSLVLGGILVVPAIVSGVWPNLSHPLSIGTAVFLSLGLVAQIGAVDQATGWYWVDFFARLALVCLLAVSLMTTPQRIIRVLAVVSGSLGFYAAKAGLLSILTGGARYAEGLSGAFPDNNGYALATVMIAPMLVAVGLNAHMLFEGQWSWLNPWMRRAFLLAVPLCAITVVSTFSRGGFLGMAAATATFVALHRRRVGLSLGLAAILVIGLSVVPIPEGYVERLDSIRTYEEQGEESALSRTYFWGVAVDMARDNVFGVGLRNYEPAYNRYDRTYGRYGSNRAVHSSHFQVVAELGFVGAVVWVSLFLLAFRFAFRARRRSGSVGLSEEVSGMFATVPNCLMASMAGFLVGGSFLSSALNDITWVTFALVAALDRLASSSATPVPAHVQRPRAAYVGRVPTAAAARLRERR